MKYLALVVLLLAVVGLSTAYWIDGMYGSQYDDDDSEYLQEDKSYRRQNRPFRRSSSGVYRTKNKKVSVNRRGLSSTKDLCIPWRAPCPSDASLSKKYHFLRCCGALSCVCTLWGNNCKCETRLGR